MMKVLCHRAATCEDGTTSMEYAVIAAVVSVALLMGAETLHTAVGDHYASLSEAISPPPQETATPASQSLRREARLVFIRLDEDHPPSRGAGHGAAPALE